MRVAVISKSTSMMVEIKVVQIHKFSSERQAVVRDQAKIFVERWERWVNDRRTNGMGRPRGGP